MRVAKGYRVGVELMFNGKRLSVLQDESVLEIGYTTMLWYTDGSQLTMV